MQEQWSKVVNVQPNKSIFLTGAKHFLFLLALIGRLTNALNISKGPLQPLDDVMEVAD